MTWLPGRQGRLHETVTTESIGCGLGGGALGGGDAVVIGTPPVPVDSNESTSTITANGVGCRLVGSAVGVGQETIAEVTKLIITYCVVARLGRADTHPLLPSGVSTNNQGNPSVSGP